MNAWLLAARPKTLPAAAAPVIMGSAVAYYSGEFHAGAALAALMVALWLQIGANIANDYFDFRWGADAGRRLGPTRVTQSGLLSPSSVIRGMLIAFFIAAVSGLYLVWLRGWIILIIGAAAIISAILYTGGPYPLGYHGWGDVFVIIFFGFTAVAGTYYVQTGSVNQLAFWSAIPMGLLVDNILIVNNYRDLESDRQVGKITLAVRLGRKWTRRQYGLNLGISYLVMLILFIEKLIPAWCLLTFLSFPLGLRLLRDLGALQGKALNETLARTGSMALIFALLFAAGIMLETMIS
jgi:1,4-dihydroxy-2-naphthoate octaprenyltransferase